MNAGEQPPEINHTGIPPLPLEELVAAGSVMSGETVSIDFGQSEVENLSSRRSKKQLSEDAEASEHRRSENFRDHFERLAVIGLWIAALTLGAISIAWVAHMVLPAKWRWLKSEDLTHIQSLVTTGLLVGVIGNHFKKRMGSGGN